VELLDGVEGTGSVEEGGGVDDGEAEREEGTNEEVARKDEESGEDVEKVLVSKVDVGVVDVMVNVAGSCVVVGVLVSVLANVMIDTVSKDLRTPAHAPRIETERRALW
jgi:hypothetical protein